MMMIRSTPDSTATHELFKHPIKGKGRGNSSGKGGGKGGWNGREE